jgi:transposase
MGTGRTDEFRKDAVQIAPNNGLSWRQVVDDLGAGFEVAEEGALGHDGKLANRPAPQQATFL